jgi:mannan endo-1,4-beta-mannosidase
VLPQIQAAYKAYVTTFVTRYRNSPVIMAWELANEPRCGADGTRNLPRSDSVVTTSNQACTPAMLSAWIDDMSAHVKRLDPHHLVTWGGEGEFALPGGSDDWAYAGADGGDFAHELALAGIDFGVFHS